MIRLGHGKFVVFVMMLVCIAVFRAGAQAAKPDNQIAETTTLDVIGTGAIYRDNVASARDDAVQDALRGVIERGVEMVISPASVVQDFQLLSDRVYGRTQSFVQDYRVLTESKSGRYYRVLVRATVSLRALQDSLQTSGVLKTQKEMPSVILLLCEQNAGSLSPECWWEEGSIGKGVSVTEDVFTRYLREKGVVTLSRKAVSSNTPLNPEYRTPQLTDAAAASLGQKTGADFAIVGRGEARYGGNIRDGYMKSIEATVSARVIETGTATVIASSQATGAVVHMDEQAGGTEALILSASETAQDITEEMMARWRQETKQAVLVELAVKGIQEYADFVRFRRQLKSEVSGVKNVYLRSIKAGEATMDVDIVGSARALADELMVRHFGNFAVNIFEVSDTSVKLELISSTDP
ncbi:MAG: hypothetical protein JRI47_07995 [Deltaproteobacteria bacterium]|nr:hypothetical protein [Deltaproteobacteria bacterium]